ncbi:MAG: hypothetical protein OXM03_04340 [Chloroflexota bacterium]|nr:hypothetical protein [Chloroflexota bacterium]
MNNLLETVQGRNEETLLIRGEDIPVLTTTLQQDTLRFFVDNPRVYSVLRKDGTGEPSQKDIQAKLLDMDHVKELIQDIKRDGGLTDPIIVRDGTLEVLEGNSRLAAYRHLVRLDPIKWGMIKVRLLPEDIDEKLILALLGQYHLKGKTAWAPYEKAGFLYRRHKNHEIPINQLALEVGETRQKVAQMVSVYQFMVDNKQDEKSRWSYYDEYLKSRYIKKERDESFDQLIVEKINSGEIGRAVDVRDKLTVICKAPRPLRKFKTGKYNFEEAYAWAVEAGADSTPYAKLAKFRKWLAAQQTERDLGRTGGETRKKIEYELKKLGPVVDSLIKKLSD